MNKRCNNPKAKDYKHYGGRGISVCDRWNSNISDTALQDFIEDMFPSWSHGLELDRRDVNGNYCIENCRWANRVTQVRNSRRCIEGVGADFYERCDAARLDCSLVRERMREGYSLEEALNTNIRYTRHAIKHEGGCLEVSDLFENSDRTGSILGRYKVKTRDLLASYFKGSQVFGYKRGGWVEIGGMECDMLMSSLKPTKIALEVLAHLGNNGVEYEL